jgi:glycerol uptake facilitator-like aquaporin
VPHSTPEPPRLLHRAVAAFTGTALLVLLGAGSAVFGIDTIGAIGGALSFGLVLPALASANSIGSALFEGGGHLTHVLLFIVAPLLGAALAVALAPLLRGPEPTGAPRKATDTTGADVPVPPPGEDSTTVPASSQRARS